MSKRPSLRRRTGARLLALTVTALALVAATACGGSSSSSSSSAAPGAGTTDKTPVTLVLWHLFAGEESKPFNEALAGFTKKYPWITIKQEVQPNTDDDTFDPNLVNAINGGNSPDVAMPFGPDYVGQYCSSGLWQDLTPYMKSAGVSISSFAPAAVTYTNYGGKQCALPSLTDAYGLYYNTSLLKNAGIPGPPKTMDELMADAKKLTVKNSDGSIKTAGFVPLNEFNELGAADLAAAWGAKWFDSAGKAQIATDPGWTKAFMWQRQLIDWYGYNNIAKFASTYTAAEFNKGNAFENGHIAMVFDGEWRTAFIGRDVPGFGYNTIAFPAADPSVYGAGRVGGTVVGIPKGAKHPDQAWLLVNYLSSDTNYLVTMANALGNVPTTAASANSPDLKQPRQFTTFEHVWANPASAFSPPLKPQGGGYANLMNAFESKWESGAIPVSGLHDALVQLDTDIDNQLAQGDSSAP